MIKLIALDLDGTLLNSEHAVSEANKQMIHAYKQSGCSFVLCTGRPHVGITSIIETLGLKGQGYAVSFNGSVIHDLATDEIVHNRPLSYQDLLEIDRLSQTIGVDYHIQSTAGIFTTSNDINIHTAFDSWLNGSRITVKGIEDLRCTDINKVLFVSEPTRLDQKIAAVPKHFRSKYNLMKSLDCFYEFLDRRANKGTALQAVSDRLGILPEEVLAIGDNDNDVSMFDFAGISVAMGNGSAKAKAAADFVTRSNDEDGVAYALEKWATCGNPADSDQLPCFFRASSLAIFKD